MGIPTLGGRHLAASLRVGHILFMSTQVPGLTIEPEDWQRLCDLVLNGLNEEQIARVLRVLGGDDDALNGLCECACTTIMDGVGAVRAAIENSQRVGEISRILLPDADLRPPMRGPDVLAPLDERVMGALVQTLLPTFDGCAGEFRAQLSHVIFDAVEPTVPLTSRWPPRAFALHMYNPRPFALLMRQVMVQIRAATIDRDVSDSDIKKVEDDLRALVGRFLATVVVDDRDRPRKGSASRPPTQSLYTQKAVELLQELRPDVPKGECVRIVMQIAVKLGTEKAPATGDPFTDENVLVERFNRRG